MFLLFQFKSFYFDFFLWEKVVELVGGGFVINGATPSSFKGTV